MPIVSINIIEGRTIDQKREMAKKITQVIAEVANTQPEKVEIIFNDIKEENYSKGGNLYIDR